MKKNKSDVIYYTIVDWKEGMVGISHMVGSSIGLLSGHASISPFPSFVV